MFSNNTCKLKVQSILITTVTENSLWWKLYKILLSNKFFRLELRDASTSETALVYGCCSHLHIPKAVTMHLLSDIVIRRSWVIYHSSPVKISMNVAYCSSYRGLGVTPMTDISEGKPLHQNYLAVAHGWWPTDVKRWVTCHCGWPGNSRYWPGHCRRNCIYSLEFRLIVSQNSRQLLICKNKPPQKTTMNFTKHIFHKDTDKANTYTEQKGTTCKSVNKQELTQWW